jgi:hypothetical protein
VKKEGVEHLVEIQVNGHFLCGGCPSHELGGFLVWGSARNERENLAFDLKEDAMK